MKANMDPIERDSLYLKISDAVYNYIRTTNLKPGDRLPSERKMAEALNTSRNSLREGLRLLEAKGLLRIKVGSGVYVNDLYGKNSTLVTKIDNISLHELQELQETLDHQAVVNALNRGSDTEKETLLTIAQQMLLLRDKGIYSHSLDYSFHTLFYKMGHNHIIHQLLEQIRNERFIYRQDTKQDNESVWLETVPQHYDLACALKNNDIKKAMESIDQILSYGFSMIVTE